MNKSTDHEDISFNIVRKLFSEMCDPLKNILRFPLEKRMFSTHLKIAKVTLFKAVDTADLSKHRPKSVIPCFSKMLDRLIIVSINVY